MSLTTDPAPRPANEALFDVLCKGSARIQACGSIPSFYRECVNLFVATFTCVAAAHLSAETDAARAREWLRHDSLEFALETFRRRRRLFRGMVPKAKYQAMRQALLQLARQQAGIPEKDCEAVAFIIRSFVIPVSARLSIERVNLLVEFARVREEKIASQEGPQRTRTQNALATFISAMEKYAGGRRVSKRDCDRFLGYKSPRPRERWEADKGCSQSIKRAMEGLLRTQPEEFFRVLATKKSKH